MHRTLSVNMTNAQLHSAKAAKNDEFYTQYYDIEREVEAYLDYNPNVFRGKTVLLPCDDPEWSNFTKYFAQNFERLGLKKLISTSYALECKQERYGIQLSLFETEFETRAPQYDAKKTRSHGKKFVLDRDENNDCRIDINDLKWQYLKGDGDFRSKEVTKLRDEADVIVTNPPFSLFREFFAWIVSASKSFLMIGNINAITYKEIFPFIKDNQMWLGATGFMTDMVFGVPKGTVVKPSDKAKAERLGFKGDYTRLGNSCWFTNMEHGRRHQSLELMTMEDSIRYSRHKQIAGKGYSRYDNYKAIEVPFIDAIPSDYTEVMGVPITFLDKYCPEQFEIVGATESEGKGFSNGLWMEESGTAQPMVNENRIYKRIFIRKKQ